MNLTFAGAAGTVTGSRYLLEHDQQRLLIDCGLFQGYKMLRLRNWAPFPVPAASIQAVVMTHAHLDHSGYLPVLVREGFRGTAFASAATRDLCGILLPDSGHLQEEEAKYANRHATSRHHPALPLYTRADATASLKCIQSIDMESPREILPGIVCVLRPAGHLLGASIVELKTGAGNLCFPVIWADPGMRFSLRHRRFVRRIIWLSNRPTEIATTTAPTRNPSSVTSFAGRQRAAGLSSCHRSRLGARRN